MDLNRKHVQNILNKSTLIIKGAREKLVYYFYIKYIVRDRWWANLGYAVYKTGAPPLGGKGILHKIWAENIIYCSHWLNFLLLPTE